MRISQRQLCHYTSPDWLVTTMTWYHPISSLCYSTIQTPLLASCFWSASLSVHRLEHLSSNSLLPDARRFCFLFNLDGLIPSTCVSIPAKSCSLCPAYQRTRCPLVNMPVGCDGHSFTPRGTGTLGLVSAFVEIR